MDKPQSPPNLLTAREAVLARLCELLEAWPEDDGQEKTPNDSAALPDAPPAPAPAQAESTDREAAHVEAN
jgi:hypothetical protein